MYLVLLARPLCWMDKPTDNDWQLLIHQFSSSFPVREANARAISTLSRAVGSSNWCYALRTKSSRSLRRLSNGYNDVNLHHFPHPRAPTKRLVPGPTSRRQNLIINNNNSLINHVLRIALWDVFIELLRLHAFIIRRISKTPFSARHGK